MAYLNKFHVPTEMEQLKSRRRVSRKKLTKSEKELHEVAAYYAKCQSDVEDIDREIARLEQELDSKKG